MNETTNTTSRLNPKVVEMMKGDDHEVFTALVRVAAEADCECDLDHTCAGCVLRYWIDGEDPRENNWDNRPYYAGAAHAYADTERGKLWFV